MDFSEREFSITDALDRQIGGVFAQGDFSKKYNINPSSLRPCVSVIWQSSFEKGGSHDRSMACSIIASEFLRLGYTQQRIETELFSWNRQNNPPLKQTDIRSTLRTALRRKYNYGCSHYFLEDFCIGEEKCKWFSGADKDGKINFRAFFSYKWQLILKNAAKLIYYLALPELERVRGSKPGGRLYVSHRELAYYAGISTRHLNLQLEELHSYNLIEYKPGTSRKWEKNATEIRRIFPIPRPPKDACKKIDK